MADKAAQSKSVGKIKLGLTMREIAEIALVSSSLEKKLKLKL